MDHKFGLRTMMFFMVPMICAIVFTALAGLVISYITSTFPLAHQGQSRKEVTSVC